MKNLFLLFAVALVLGSCNMSYEKTKSGLRYKIIKGKGGAKLTMGSFVKFNQEVSIPERDTVLNSTYGKMPGYVKIDTGAASVYSFVEVLQKMSVGDSAVIIFSVDSLKKRNMIPDYDNTFRRGGQITFKLRVLKSYATENEVNEDYQKDLQAEQGRRAKESEVATKKEAQDLDEYLKKNNITTVKTPSGAFVEIQNAGTGMKADTGTTAIVFYTGKLLKDGTTFDSNKDPKFNHTEPLQVVIGSGSMIKGFDEGLRVFGKGGKGRIFIPSVIGFGPQGSPPVIPGNATLIFEVDVNDVIKGSQPPAPVAPR